SILFPLLFALLINPKPFNYLITIVPLFCLVLAVGFSRLLSTPRRMVQIFAGCILVVTLLQGTLGIYQMQVTASRSVPANQSLEQLRAGIPAHRRVLGHPQYWLGFMDDEYRSFLLPFLFA